MKRTRSWNSGGVDLLLINFGKGEICQGSTIKPPLIGWYLSRFRVRLVWKDLMIDRQFLV